MSGDLFMHTVIKGLVILAVGITPMSAGVVTIALNAKVEAVLNA